MSTSYGPTGQLDRANTSSSAENQSSAAVEEQVALYEEGRQQRTQVRLVT